MKKKPPPPMPSLAADFHGVKYCVHSTQRREGAGGPFDFPAAWSLCRRRPRGLLPPRLLELSAGLAALAGLSPQYRQWSWLHCPPSGDLCFSFSHLLGGQDCNCSLAFLQLYHDAKAQDQTYAASTIVHSTSRDACISDLAYFCFLNVWFVSSTHSPR